MRFIQGPSLRDKLKQLHDTADAAPLVPGEERPTLPRLLRHFIGACHAVAYAHSRGVLHRDLKPEHVLLGPFGETLVVDWGLATPIPGGDASEAALDFPPVMDAALAQEGMVVGTLPYMSPEQALGMLSSMDRRSDVYALGAILYALSTGRPPIQGCDFSTMLSRARRGDFPRPREVAPGVPPALEAICLKAMSHDREARYATATELGRDVERWLDDEPTVAYPEPIAARAGRWLRRHRTAAVAAIVALTCATAGLIVLNARTVAANAEIRRQRDRAEAARADAVAAANQREANFRASLDAINGYLRGIGAEDIPDAPGTTALRRDIADVTAKLLNTLEEQQPEDAEVRYMAGRAYREHANILRLLGRPTDGSYSRAFEMLRGAVAARPQEPRYRDYLSETLRDAAGRHQLANRPAAAAPLLAEARDLVARLRREHPNAPNYARSDARVTVSVAENLILIGEFEEARAHAARALALMKPLADGRAPGATDRLEVVAFLCVLGDALVGAEKPSEAAPTLDEAIARAEAGLADAPGDPDFRLLAGCAQTQRARALAALGQGDDARTAIDAAAALFDGLTADYPEIVHYRENLADALISRAEGLAASGAPADARRDLDRARSLAEGLVEVAPENLAYVGLLGRAEGRSALIGPSQGEPAEARSRLERAIALQHRALKDNPRSPRDLRALKDWEAAMATLPPAAE
jgi:tetratricopeptide (TPR) repeat protein